MKIFLTTVIVVFALSMQAQSASKCKTKFELADSNYVIISRQCKNEGTHILSEGYVKSVGKVNEKNFQQYRHGVWKFYDSGGQGILSLTIEFYNGVRLGVNTYKNNDGSSVTYTTVKEGNSTITYYDKRGRKTEEHIYDLNDPSKKTIKTFYDIHGRVIKSETWIDGIIQE